MIIANSVIESLQFKAGILRKDILQRIGITGYVKTATETLRTGSNGGSLKLLIIDSDSLELAPQQPARERSDMTLWDVMTIICATAPMGGAIGIVQSEHKGWLWYGLAVIIGGVVGFLCAWGMRAFGGEYARRFAAGPNVQEWRFRLLYLLASAWIILAAFIGGWVMQAVMHII